MPEHSPFNQYEIDMAWAAAQGANRAFDHLKQVEHEDAVIASDPNIIPFPSNFSRRKKQTDRLLSQSRFRELVNKAAPVMLDRDSPFRVGANHPDLVPQIAVRSLAARITDTSETTTPHNFPVK